MDDIYIHIYIYNTRYVYISYCCTPHIMYWCYITRMLCTGALYNSECTVTQYAMRCAAEAPSPAADRFSAGRSGPCPR